MSSLIPFRQIDDIVRIDFADCILAKLDKKQLCDEFTVILSKLKNPKVLLSLKDVEHVSSESLGVFLTLHEMVKRQGGQFRLCEVERKVQPIFGMTRIDQIITINDSAKSAMQSFT